VYRAGIRPREHSARLCIGVGAGISFAKQVCLLLSKQVIVSLTLFRGMGPAASASRGAAQARRRISGGVRHHSDFNVPCHPSWSRVPRVRRVACAGGVHACG